MGGSQKNIGQGKDDAITNPIQQKPYRHNGLQRKCQQRIPAPKSEENDAITNSLLKYAKNQTIHKAVRSPTHYLQGSKGWIYSPGGAITYPLSTKKVTRDTYTKTGGQGGKRHTHQKREVNFYASHSIKGGEFSPLAFTNVVKPTGGRFFAHKLSTKEEVLVF